MTDRHNPTWTAKLRATCGDIATGWGSADLKSRASEIFNGAKLGAQLSDLNVEFITAMRSRFDPSADPRAVAVNRAFDDAWRDAWEAANPPPPPTFVGLDWDGADPAKITRDGFTFTATTHPDPDHDAPWDSEDGHGPVRIAPAGNQTADERVLGNGYGRQRHYYDWAAALEIATRDGWGPGTPEEAVQADFDRLGAYVDGDWGYLGVAVVATRNGHPLTGEFGHALWGIDSDAGGYFAEVADELVPEALAEAQQALADLIEGDGDIA